MSHNSLGMSYCRFPAKRTGISWKTSAFIEGRNRADREVPAYFARGGTGWYGTLKVKKHFFKHSTPISPVVSEIKLGVRGSYAAEKLGTLKVNAPETGQISVFYVH